MNESGSAGEPSLRRGRAEELPWINERYDTIGFAHTAPSDTIAIATIDEVPAGLGRLVPVAPATVELGGILVFEEFRERGLASLIVEYLLAERGAATRIFCLPFAHLRGFYERHGFLSFDPAVTPIPTRLTEKLDWCGRTYEHETVILLQEFPRADARPES